MEEIEIFSGSAAEFKTNIESFDVTKKKIHFKVSIRSSVKLKMEMIKKLVEEHNIKNYKLVCGLDSGTIVDGKLLGNDYFDETYTIQIIEL